MVYLLYHVGVITFYLYLNGRSPLFTEQNYSQRISTIGWKVYPVVGINLTDAFELDWRLFFIFSSALWLNESLWKIIVSKNVIQIHLKSKSMKNVKTHLQNFLQRSKLCSERLHSSLTHLPLFNCRHTLCLDGLDIVWCRSISIYMLQCTSLLVTTGVPQGSAFDPLLLLYVLLATAISSTATLSSTVIKLRFSLLAQNNIS